MMGGGADPDPTNSGTAGDAGLWVGSSAVVGMAANRFRKNPTNSATKSNGFGFYYYQTLSGQLLNVADKNHRPPRNILQQVLPGVLMLPQTA